MRLSGRDYDTVTVLPRRQVPHATGRGMPIGTSNSQAPLPHSESLHALDWLNFFLAALLMGFGPFVAVKLADRGWMPATIGLVLTTSGIAGLLTQVPAGELIDISRSKRILVGMATIAIITGVMIFAPRPDLPSALAAALIQGTAGSLLGPGGRGYQPGLSWARSARGAARSQSALRLDRRPDGSRHYGCYRLRPLHGRYLCSDRRIRGPGDLGARQDTLWRHCAPDRHSTHPHRVSAPFSSETVTFLPLPFASFCSNSRMPLFCHCSAKPWCMRKSGGPRLSHRR